MPKEKFTSFENRLTQLNEIVQILEQGEISLSESVTLYKEGLELSTKCKEELEKAKHEVKILQNGNLENFPIDQNQENINSFSEED